MVEVQDKPEIKEEEELCYNLETKTYFAKQKTEKLEDPVQTLVVNELYEQLVRKFSKLNEKITNLAQDGVKDILVKQKVTELLGLHWSGDEKDRVHLLAQKYLKQVGNTKEELESQKQNAQELLQFKKLSQSLSQRIEDLETPENQRYLFGLRTGQVLQVLQQREEKEKEFFDFLENEKSEFVKNLKWELFQRAIKGKNEEDKEENIFKRQATKKIERAEQQDDSFEEDIEEEAPQNQQQESTQKGAEEETLRSEVELEEVKDFELPNKAIYNGQVRVSDKEKHGKGAQKWPDGSYYEGDWKNGKAEGKGKLNHADGDVYEGDWVADQAHGFGTYNHANGARYEGEWIKDKQHGQGKEHWPDGASYEGEYFEGKKHGKGCLQFADGSTYKGEFARNEINGEGHYTWPDGKKYQGEWVGNKMHGKGKLEWADGKKYEGHFQEDKRQGHGFFTWADGRKYDGEWVEGKQNGLGLYQDAKGVERKGEWIQGKRVRWIVETDS